MTLHSITETMASTFIIYLATLLWSSAVILAESEPARCVVQYDKESPCLQKTMCPEDGMAVMVDHVVVSEMTECAPNGYIRTASSDIDLDKVLVSTIRRECNGKRTCDLQESLKNRFTVSCDRPKSFEADAIDIRHYCRPFGLNHTAVYDMGSNQNLNVKDQTFYLVLDSPSMDTNRTCIIRGDRTGFNFLLLHVDMETPSYCRFQNGRSCSEILSIVGDGKRLVTYTHKTQPEVLQSYKVNETVNLHVTSGPGLLWIELTGIQSSVLLTCEGASREESTTTATATTTTTTPTTTTPTTPVVTTNTPLSDITTPTTTTSNATMIKPWDGLHPSVLTLIILVTVIAAGLFISLGFNIFYVRKSRRLRVLANENMYSYPEQRGCGSYTYSGLDDEAPPTPARNGEEYLEIKDYYTTEYLDVEHKEYNIPQDAGHRPLTSGQWSLDHNNSLQSVTDNADY
ncbi:hypothetical protein BgiMline_015005 [Biomphalaria glabrata]|uniref:Uncharacterized protein LOC106056436 isoform X1 n=2 Tax=Biomphalaria glabrata TaxID=6526 RepID=A0A9U8E1R8_BIOGL|nr:uncharacterized protein LOC106056436 isoform X1 [Biomphalaria glabrata]KAI8742349.1 hypothetical protein BgiMline_022122 [Biomphalaria glabrata]